MASLKQLDERRYKITVSNGYRPDGRKVCKARTLHVPKRIPRRSVLQYVMHAAEELEKEFYEAAGIRLGRVEISRNKDRFCFVVPEEGAEYVHEKRSGNSFIKKLVALLQTHPCTIEDIHKLFLETGEKIHFEKIETEDFDYLIYFESGEDSYYYCFKDEGCHIIYHRFMPEDYQDLFSESVE